MVLLLLFIIGVVVWGVLDGRADAQANPDPDRREDLAMTWLLAGLFAGVVSGARVLAHRAVLQGPVHRGTAQRGDDVRGVHRAAVFVSGIIGVAVGRWRVDRKLLDRKEPTKRTTAT